ncbi:MAG: ABC transporter ATP-binding protein [Gemmatimonadota bacterium]
MRGLARRRVGEGAWPARFAVPAPRSRLAVRTEGLTKDFPTVRAVDKLCLEVPRGSVFGFLGPNGAGKTTTIRLLLGLIKPTGGTAWVLGYDCAAQSAHVRRHCGVLLEHAGLVERLSAEDNLDVYGRIWRIPRSVRRARARELLLHLGLWDRRQERIGTWSRGMKQRVALARALLHRPSVVFLDEPTAGLDPVAAAALRRDLMDLARREGVTVFLNTHNLSEAARLCDLVGVVRDGRLLSVGPPEELQALHSCCRLRLRGTGFTASVLELLGQRKEVTSTSRQPNGWVMVELSGDVDVAPLVTFLVRLGVGLEEVARADHSLEDAVLSLVKGEVPANGSWLVSGSA